MYIRDFIKDAVFETIDLEYMLKLNKVDVENWLKTIPAFANSQGGNMFIGVSNNGFAIGIDSNIVDQEVRYINQIISNKIYPEVDYSFSYIELENNKTIIQINIKKSINSLIGYRREDGTTIIYIRKEGETVPATIEAISKLSQRLNTSSFDSVKTNEFFDIKNFNEFTDFLYEQTGKELSIKKLKTINVVLDDNYLTNAGLLFMDNCQIDNNSIHCRLWPGFTKGSDAVLDDKKYQGNIIKKFLLTMEFIKNHINNGFSKINLGQEKIISYPERAIQEAVINAIAHRDYYLKGSQIDVDIYKDRIEILSPGSFLFAKNAQDYIMNEIPSRRRNERICDMLTLCELMEQNGSGFEKILNEYKKYQDIYQPRIESNQDSFLIVLMNLTYKEEGIGQRSNQENINFISINEYLQIKEGKRDYDKKILQFCFNTPHSRSEIQEYIGILSRDYFRREILSQLLNAKYLLPTQSNPNSPIQKYYTNLEKVKSSD
jgi:predicted HTH transcriptional regulator